MFSALDGRIVLAVMYAIVTVAVVLGVIGRSGIPMSHRRSRLPVALQGALLGASLVAVFVAVAGSRAWSHMVLLAWIPALFPEAVPAAVFRRMVSGSTEDEDHVPSGPRWQDLPRSGRR